MDKRFLQTLLNGWMEKEGFCVDFRRVSLKKLRSHLLKVIWKDKRRQKNVLKLSKLTEYVSIAFLVFQKSNIFRSLRIILGRCA